MRWIRLAEAVLADEGVRGPTEVSILYVDEATIADLNSRFLGKEGPTDVLAFPIDEEPVEGGRSPDSGGTGPGFSPTPDDLPTLLGDVVICPAVAHRNAPEHAGTVDDELALLLVHGLLHLLGLDHEDPEEAEIMEAKERELLGRHHGSVPDSAYPTVASDEGAAAAPAVPPAAPAVPPAAPAVTTAPAPPPGTPPAAAAEPPGGVEPPDIAEDGTGP
ncbi:MAG: rRNA maturation RNase YbeY [Acidobacteriota bacterium]|nr:rRNA maturation RNase YbeY [Acidobacteriota bacterium]